MAWKCQSTPHSQSDTELETSVQLLNCYFITSTWWSSSYILNPMRWHFWAPKMADNSKIRDFPNGMAAQENALHKTKGIKVKSKWQDTWKIYCFLLFYLLVVSFGYSVNWLVQQCFSWVCVVFVCVSWLLKFAYLTLHYRFIILFVYEANNFIRMPVPLITISYTFCYRFLNILNVI